MNPNETRLLLSVVDTPISQESVEKLVQRLRRRAEIPLMLGDLPQAFAVCYDSGEADRDAAFQARLLTIACFIHWMAAWRLA